MPRRRKDCPLCGKQNLVKLSNHLAGVHRLSCEERRPYLAQASALENDRQKPLAKIIFEITIKAWTKDIPSPEA